MELKRIDRLISNFKSWNELFYDLSSNKQYTEKFKGDVFERVTQAYLLTVPKYKSTLSEVWLNEEVPRSVLKKLNLPSKDHGVDLITKTKRNEYWTVQCKFRSSNVALNYKQLSTFLSQSFITGKNVRLALVAHTSSKPIRNRGFLKNMSEIGSGTWLDLTEEEWGNIRKHCKRKPIKIVKRKPRPHQTEVINDAKKYFLEQKNSRGKLIMPCATGKSLAAFWISQSLDAKKVIVAVPSLALIKQSLNDWTKEYMAHGVVPEWLCICSDESTGKVDIDEFNTDTYDLGIPTTTKKSEIVEFLKRRTKAPKIIFTTYQSSPRLTAAAKDSKTNFDLCILDEAHKTVGSKGKIFSTLLFDENIKIKKRLFMTATERVLRGKDDEVASMDDPKLYGGFVYEMTFKEAIERNIISDYKVITIGISDSQIRELVKKNRFLDPELGKLEEASAQNLASGIALKKAFKKHKIKHAISFHRSINLAKKFQEQQDELNAVQSLRPKVQNLHISSKKSSGERVELIKEFIQFDRSLLTNARCLTEGVDVPAIDCVMFVDPKQSVIDIVQASGRALRKHDGKEFGYILLPLVVPDGMDIEEFSETTAFKTITRIVASLSWQDERIIEEFRLEKHGRISSGTIINIDIDLKLGKKIDISEFSDFISTKIWEKVAKVNYRSFEEAREYARGLGLKNYKEWSKHSKNNQLPYDIPATPDYVYKNKGWEGYGDFFGTGYVSSAKREFRPFKEAREYIRSLGFKNSQEWREFAKSDERPEDIPTNPHTVYEKDGWIGAPDWIGNKNRNRNIPYTSFEEARKYARTLNLKTQSEWLEHTRAPDFPIEIHKAPHKYYKNKGWESYGDFLGTGNIATSQRKYRSFKEAREYARSLNLKSRKEWTKHTKTPGFPDDIPVGLERAYKDEWTSMGDFLGSGFVATSLREYRSFEEARKYARSLNLKNEKEWRKVIKTNKFPEDIPHNPLGFYKEQWIGMGDWLGSGQRNRNIPYKPFKEARKYAKSLNLKSSSEWVKHTKKPGFPEDIPKDPRIVYKNKGWKGMGDWLGNK